MSANPDHDELISQLCQTTSLQPDIATQFLIQSNWDIEQAASNYFASLEDSDQDDQDTEASAPQPPPSGPRTLDGNFVPQPIPTTNSSNQTSNPKSSQPKKKFATLGDLGGGGASSGGHHNHSDDSDSEDQDFFAGGEKSGLAVQNPDDLKKRIIDKAKRGASRPNGDDPQPQSSNFRGTAQTLGGDDAPSRVIEDPTANIPKPPERVERHLHFWSNGFSVDDGPLHNSEDPENARILNMIRRGQAPLSLMDVQENQEVDVKLEPHDGPYVQPKKKYQPFGGSGQRLGSPTPGISSSSASTTITMPPAAAVPLTSTGGNSAQASQPSVDASQPAVSLQIRLGDGTRLVSRFNLSHTIGDVYAFVNASNPASQARNWALMTTFPSKELSDKGKTLEDTPELKRGGTVMQKWT